MKKWPRVSSSLKIRRRCLASLFLADLFWSQARTLSLSVTYNIIAPAQVSPLAAARQMKQSSSAIAMMTTSSTAFAISCSRSMKGATWKRMYTGSPHSMVMHTVGVASPPTHLTRALAPGSAMRSPGVNMDSSATVKVDSQDSSRVKTILSTSHASQNSSNLALTAAAPPLGQT